MCGKGKMASVKKDKVENNDQNVTQDPLLLLLITANHSSDKAQKNY